MNEQIIKVNLQKLQNTLNEIKTLLAWEDLKHSETIPGQPPGFTVADTTRQDIQEQYSRFLAIRMQIRGILNNTVGSSLTKSKQATFRQELTRLEDQFKSFNLSAWKL